MIIHQWFFSGIHIYCRISQKLWLSTTLKFNFSNQEHEHERYEHGQWLDSNVTSGLDEAHSVAFFTSCVM